jgi:hypothetical protein
MVEAIALGVNWPESFKAKVRNFSRSSGIVTLELESDECRVLDLSGYTVRVSSVRKPARDLEDWTIVRTFSLRSESGDAGATFTELREFGRAV